MPVTGGLTTHSLLYFYHNSVQFKPGEIPILRIFVQLYSVLMYFLHLSLQTQKNFHAMLLVLIYLEEGLKRSDTGVVMPANTLQEHKNTFVLPAVSLEATHAHVGLLMTKVYLYRYVYSLL